MTALSTDISTCDISYLRKQCRIAALFASRLDGGRIEDLRGRRRAEHARRMRISKDVIGRLPVRGGRAPVPRDETETGLDVLRA